jgi:hypothetical protein
VLDVPLDRPFSDASARLQIRDWMVAAFSPRVNRYFTILTLPTPQPRGTSILPEEAIDPMSRTEEQGTEVSRQDLADAQAVLAHAVAGTPLEPELAQRVRARADGIRQQILATQGVQDIGVQYIRELRGDLPS